MSQPKMTRVACLLTAIFLAAAILTSIATAGVQERNREAGKAKAAKRVGVGAAIGAGAGGLIGGRKGALIGAGAGAGAGAAYHVHKKRSYRRHHRRIRRASVRR